MIQFKEIEAEKPKMTRVIFDTTAYEFNHGRRPRGREFWAFEFGFDASVYWMTPGSTTFTDAKKLARAEALRRGFSGVVYVLPFA